MRHNILRNLILAGMLLTLGALLPAAGETLPAAVASTTLAGRPSFLGYYAYYGDLHQHTGFSPDGCVQPAKAMSIARQRGNDFIAITEHHSGFRANADGVRTGVHPNCTETATDPRKWQTLATLAATHTSDGNYVVVRGYEHTQTHGHINIFNSSTVYSPLDLDDLYSWLAAQPANVYAQFNHPFPADWPNTYGDFDDFSFYPPVAAKMRAIETFASPPAYALYPHALAREWQVSATSWTDGHDGAAAGKRFTGLFAPEITRAALDSALSSGRTFGNTDGQLAVALVGNGRWMGSPVNDDRITFQGYAADMSGDTIERIELSGPAGVIASWEPRTNPALVTYTVESVQPGDFFNLHVVDSRHHHAWSGSITRPRYHRLQTNPAALRFVLSAAGQPTTTQSFILQANDGADVPWQAVPQADWVSVYPDQGDHLPAVISVTVSPDGLAAGSRSTAIELRALHGNLVPTLVGVQEEIGAAAQPKLTIFPRRQELAASLSQPQVTGWVDLGSTGPDLAWFAAPSVPWLHISPASGQGAGRIQFTADLSGYPIDTYTGHVVVNVGAQTRVAEVRVLLQPPHARRLDLQQGLNGYTGVRDTFISAGAPDTPYGGSAILRISNAGTEVPLLRFDLSAIPSDATVFTATLSLYASLRETSSEQVWQLYPLLRGWDETATWRQAATGEPWAAEGLAQPCADIPCRPFSTQVAYPDQRWYDFDVTPLVRAWVAHPEQNHGVALIAAKGVSVHFTFPASQSDAWKAPLRPKLSLVYGDAVPTATPTATATATRAPTETPTPTVTVTEEPTATPQPARRLYLPSSLRP